MVAHTRIPIELDPNRYKVGEGPALAGSWYSPKYVAPVYHLQNLEGIPIDLSRIIPARCPIICHSTSCGGVTNLPTLALDGVVFIVLYRALILRWDHKLLISSKVRSTMSRSERAYKTVLCQNCLRNLVKYEAGDERILAQVDLKRFAQM